MLVVIQARSNSKRFKNKVMHLIYNKPLIWHVVSRIRKAKKIKKVVVASSINKTDNKLVNYLRKNRIDYFRGELNNVAKRMFNVAQKYKAPFFMRISGDSPLIDHKIIDRAISIFYSNKKKYDLITNVHPRTFPKGQSVEIINCSVFLK